MGISALLAAQILDASATGRSVLTGADASAIRTTLGLGTLATQSATITDYLTIASAASTYQPLNSDLTSIAALSTTSFGRGLLTESSATTARTTLGLGSSAVLNAGSANGVATLGADSKLTAAQIPDISLISYLGSVASQAAMLALSGQQGDWCVRSDLSTTWVITGSDPTQIGNWTQLSYPSVPVQSVFGRTGAVVGVSTDYSSVGITNTAIGASNPSTGAFTTLSTTGRITTPSILLSGNYSSTAWTTSGVGLSHTARTLTDTTSTGTVATAYTNVLGGNTIAASNATTFTDYASLFLGSPSAGTNVTITNAFSLITQGAARFGGAVGINAGTLNGTVLDIAQTWGGTGTYTGIKYNVTDSGPANAASLLMDLQVGGSSRFSVKKDSQVAFSGVAWEGKTLVQAGYTTTGWGLSAGNWYWGSGTGAGAWKMGLHQSHGVQVFNQFGFNNDLAGSPSDLILVRDAAQTLAQRNGLNPQVHRWYNTYTDASNYERAKIAWESNVLRIGTEKVGTGSARALELQTDGVTRLTIDTAGDATFANAIRFSSNNAVLQNASSNRIYIQNSSTINAIIAPASTSLFQLRGGYFLGWSDTGFSINVDTAIGRNAAGVLEINNGTGGTYRDLICRAATFSGNVTVSAVNIVTDTTTGTKIGTATTQKLGFYDKTPVVQPTAVADATDAASVITQLNALLSRMRDLGLIAT